MIEFLYLAFILAQIHYRTYVGKTTEEYDQLVWDACLYPGGKLEISGNRGFADTCMETVCTYPQEWHELKVAQLS